MAATALTFATIIGLVLLAGRIYANAILRSGPKLSLDFGKELLIYAPRSTLHSCLIWGRLSTGYG